MVEEKEVKHPSLAFRSFDDGLGTRADNTKVVLASTQDLSEDLGEELQKVEEQHQRNLQLKHRLQEIKEALEADDADIDALTLGILTLIRDKMMKK